MMLVLFIVYILLNSFTMMNMLVGLIAEVVANTADSEQKRILEESVCDSIKAIYHQMDADKNGLISKDEFESMRVDPEVRKALADLDIKDKQFAQFADLLFQKGPASDKGDQYCDFDNLLNVLLRLRPGNQVSVLDFAAFGKGFENSNKQLIERMTSLEKELAALDSPNPPLPAPPALTSNGVVGTDVQREHIRMLTKLEKTSSADIISELQRRLGMQNLEESGVPLSMMNDDLKARVRAAESLPDINSPYFSKETLRC